MKKIVIERPGYYDQLKIKEEVTPTPKKGEVLIEVKACGVNFADCCVRMGIYSSAKEFIGLPITPGFEVAGVIKAVGEGVTQFSIGQKVIALTFFGGYATHLTVPIKQVFLIPPHLEFAQAASLPVNYLTAYYALFELGAAKPKNKVLVHSAAGGVGSALIQLGKLHGCDMVGIVGASHKVWLVKGLGAFATIDKSKSKWSVEAEKLFPHGYDIVLDANGEETLSLSYKHLALGGRLVVYGFHSMLTKGKGIPNWLKLIWQYLRTPRFNPLKMTNDNHSVLAFNLSYMFNRSELLETPMKNLITLFNEKKLVPPLITTYAFEEVQKAHRDLETGQTVGKLVLITK